MKQTITIALLVLSIAALGCIMPQQEQEPEEYHAHADFKVYLNGQAINFSQERYMETTPFIHFHDMDGDVIHAHRDGLGLEILLESMGMRFNSTCLVTDSGESYCNDEENNIKFYVNGAPNGEFENYVFEDMDRILISYGPSGEDLAQQLGSVTDKSCIQSKKCPERGEPSDESSCVAGEVCVAI
jgi:hypothetical protein